MVQRHGGAANRPGTQFIAEVSDSTRAIRLIPFVFNASQTHVLEFGHLYMRVITDGVQGLETLKTITSIVRGPAPVGTIAAHGYANGDEIAVSQVVGMTQLNGRNFKVASVTANTFELEDMGGTALDSTPYDDYVSGGKAGRVYQIATPYVEADLATLQYVQSADVVAIVHPNYASRELSRLGALSWTLTEIDFEPAIDPPHGGTAVAGAAGANVYLYRVTAIADETFEESLPGRGAAFAISAATQANPVTVTAVGHPFVNGDEVFIAGVVGMTEINDRRFTVANVAGNDFDLMGEDGTGYGAWTAGGTAAQTYIRLAAAAVPTSAAPHVITIPQIAGARAHNIYRAVSGVYGLIGSAVGATFSDVGTDPDILDTPPDERNPFAVAGDYPSAVTYYQQRLMLGNTTNDPEKVFASRTGLFSNFTTSSPIQDDDAITFRLSGRQVNAVKHMAELGILVMFTSGGEWSIAGDQAGILKPDAVNPKSHSFNGSGDLAPINVNGSLLYVQARGSIIRDLAFQIEEQAYRGNDLTIFAAHLFDGFTLVDWAYQQVPHSIVWAVRSDGVLLGLTYVREHAVWAWHRHDFTGEVENVCVVPEGSEDSLYVVVARTINGRDVKYIERLSRRIV